jgi:hypothetical protein
MVAGWHVFVERCSAGALASDGPVAPAVPGVHRMSELETYPTFEAAVITDAIGGGGHLGGPLSRCELGRRSGDLGLSVSPGVPP